MWYNWENEIQRGKRMQVIRSMRGRANLALFVVTLIWGSTFVIVKSTLDTVSPFLLISSRFWAAALSLGVVYLLYRPAKSNSPVVRDGILTGLVLAVGFITQTLGLMTTEAGKTAFITGLNVVMVPVFSIYLLKVKPERSAIYGVILATIGLGFLTLDKNLSFAPGDLWVLLCAVFFALHIIITDQISPRHEVITFTLIQMITVAIVSLTISLILGYDKLIPPISALPSLLYLGVVATGVVFGLQTWAQRHTSPTHTALIFVLEPVFAAIFAVIFTNERLAGWEWFGGFMILLGMVVAETRNIDFLQIRKKAELI
jgi:drug/metabolite transporter (DMT)-like permease